MKTVRYRLRNIDASAPLYNSITNCYEILVDGDLVSIPRRTFNKLFVEREDNNRGEAYNMLKAPFVDTAKLYKKTDRSKEDFLLEVNKHAETVYNNNTKELAYRIAKDAANEVFG